MFSCTTASLEIEEILHQKLHVATNAGAQVVFAGLRMQRLFLTAGLRLSANHSTRALLCLWRLALAGHLSTSQTDDAAGRDPDALEGESCKVGHFLLWYKRDTSSGHYCADAV